ncbi:MAG: hypothetical protein KJ607_10125 [Bacteroidetes bacterium]|nr:hypothetical protein [Bacteroidota bacterium]
MKPDYSKTKIIATIGPASAPKEVLREMILSGVDVCRLNFSHGKQEDHARVIQTIKELREELDIHVSILADLQGPKLRVGQVENNGVELINGATIRFVTEECMGTADKVYLSYREFPRDVSKGETILIDDGKIKLEVIDTNGTDCVTARVIFGGILRSRKGVNLPNTKISLPSLTEEDIDNLNFVLDFDIDWVALSFVRTVTDIVELKSIIKKRKKYKTIL